ncbi:MAG: PspC domain-containing protein [Muribaculum sp.]|nr:PspC domain-containing protein [Muribaculum sp.]
MKRTYSINISGEPFIIDEDAYELLTDYLSALRHSFEKYPEGANIIEDIEARISEIYCELREEGYKIITLKDVEEVIARIGRPEEIITVAETNVNAESETYNSIGSKDEQENVTPPPFNSDEFELTEGAKSKRLYRDTKDKVLGGVCSGLAHYVGIDPVWIRLIMVLLFFLSTSTIFVVYIVLWIAMPPANTPLRRLQMYGKSQSIQNIGKMVSSMFDNSTNRDSGSGQSTFTRILSVLAKIFMVMLSLVAVPVLIAMASAFVASLGMLILSPFNVENFILKIFGEQINGPENVVLLSLASMGGSVALGIPCALVIWCTGTMFFRNWNITRQWGLGLIISWVVGLSLAVVSGIVLAGQGVFNHTDNLSAVQDIRIEQIESIEETAEERIESINDAAERLADSLEQLNDLN